MRVKQVFDAMPLPAKCKLMWSRITFSRLTIFYVLFSLAHCFVQVVFQSQAFVVNQQASSDLLTIITQGNATIDGFPVFGHELRACSSVPDTLSAKDCKLIWSPERQAAAQAAASSAAASASSVDADAAYSTAYTAADSTPTATLPSITSSITAAPTKALAANAAATVTQTITTVVKPTPSASAQVSKRANVLDNIKVTAADPNSASVTVSREGRDIELTRTCLLALNWPVETLLNTKREDIAFIAFQIWVLGMSIMALLNESIPHIIASLLTHMLATAWGGFQINNTASFRTQFNTLTTNGACSGHNLLPNYWQERRSMEYPSLVLNVVALAVSAFLSWRLVKLFGWQTFKRVGASLTINRIYKIVLTLSIVIQLTLFFLVTTVALWIDQLYNGSIAHFASESTLYKVMFTLTLFLMVPWLSIGWFAVRREKRRLMLVFLVLCVLYLAGWGGMFASTTFRWTFIEWRLFSVMASASAFLVTLACGLGVACRINFGKGLPRYLNAQEPLPGDDFEPATVTGAKDLEKVDFPSEDEKAPIPTFSAAFGSGSEVPVPSQMFPAHMVKGMRAFKIQQDEIASTGATAGHSRQQSQNSIDSTPSSDLHRQGSQSSQHSQKSTSSADSSASRSKRWVIEM